MIDLTKEDPVPLAEVPKLRILPRRPDGKRVHMASIYRWTSDGLKGVILESIQCGGTRCTTVAALQRFFVALSKASKPVEKPTRTRRQYRQAQAAAEAELDRAGVGGVDRRSRGRRASASV